MEVKICNNCKKIWLDIEKCSCGCTTLTETHYTNYVYAENRHRDFTPDPIRSLKPYEVFVFGSNPQGRHGAGAAKAAVDYYGAEYGNGFGFQGQSYAIATIDLRLPGRRNICDEFIVFQLQMLEKEALANPDLDYLLTKIGCGLGGFTIEQMKKLVDKVDFPQNVILPKEFN